ncbi:acetolactate decarboxylase [Legionella yabuuchiae]|uniref:acetolactate decarboxylase n=1 Tax=Legionella yabuuchiae TaxID=376727 RepID=UPI0010563CAC|nr:acetolactate decarboxylase [Legionella yabuuchiae]
MKNKLYITGMLNAMLQGVYEGDDTVHSLLANRSCGIGTFDRVDGELIADQGQCYQVKADGKLRLADSSTKVPWAMAADFTPEKTFTLKNLGSLSKIDEALAPHLTSENYFHIIRIIGSFNSIKYRSECPQKKPYRPMYETLPSLQREFTVDKVEKAVLIAFYTPDYFSFISGQGFHYHFYDENTKTGGHILKASLHEARVELAHCLEVTIRFIDSSDFKNANIGEDLREQLKKLE